MAQAQAQAQVKLIYLKQMLFIGNAPIGHFLWVKREALC